MIKAGCTAEKAAWVASLILIEVQKRDEREHFGGACRTLVLLPNDDEQSFPRSYPRCPANMCGDAALARRSCCDMCPTQVQPCGLEQGYVSEIYDEFPAVPHSSNRCYLFFLHVSGSRDNCSKIEVMTDCTFKSSFTQECSHSFLNVIALN